jgi:hypothetical protein
MLLLSLVLAAQAGPARSRRRVSGRGRRYPKKRAFAPVTHTLAASPMTMWSPSKFEEAELPSLYLVVFCLCGLTTSVIAVAIWATRLCRGDKGGTAQAVQFMRSVNEVL